jgi:hypothetical protein
MALGSTQPLTEMSIGNLPWGKGRPALKAKMWEPKRLTRLWASEACLSFINYEALHAYFLSLRSNILFSTLLSDTSNGRSSAVCGLYKNAKNFCVYRVEWQNNMRDELENIL